MQTTRQSIQYIGQTTLFPDCQLCKPSPSPLPPSLSLSLCFSLSLSSSPHTHIQQSTISVLPRTKGKAYWEGVTWVESATTSKLLALPNSHIKEKLYRRHIVPISLKYAGENTDNLGCSYLRYCHIQLSAWIKSGMVEAVYENSKIPVKLLIGASRSEPLLSHTYKKIVVLMYVHMYVRVYVVIRHPRAHQAHACTQIDTVKIVSIDHMLTLNVVHQTTAA